MKQITHTVISIEAEEGKVFDWADLSAHQIEDEEGNVVQEHLYAKVLFLSENDSVDNYVEVVKED